MSRLSNRKLNKMISDATDSINVPNVMENAKKVPINTCDAPAKTKNVGKVAFFTSLACCIIIVATCLGVFLPMQQIEGDSGGAVVAVNQITYVTIDINPSFTIKLNNDSVVSITSNNMDGAIVISGVDVTSLEGKNYSDAINALLNESAKTGYLEYEDVNKQKTRNAVKVAVLSDETTDLDGMLDKVEQSCKNYFVDNNLYAVVIKDKILQSKQTVDEVKEKYGITYSKYELIKASYLELKGKFAVDNEADFDSYVRQNVDTRISDLYNVISSKKNENIKKIYSIINEAISNEEGFNSYISSIITKNNELESFIDSKLEDVVSYLQNAKQEMENYISQTINDKKFVIKNNIKEVYDEIKNNQDKNKEHLLKDIENIISWIKDNLDHPLDFDFFDIENSSLIM